MTQNRRGNKHLNVLIWVKKAKILKKLSNKSQENINNLNAGPSVGKQYTVPFYILASKRLCWLKRIKEGTVAN